MCATHTTHTTHPHTAHPHTPTHTHTHTPSPPGGFDQKILKNLSFLVFTIEMCATHTTHTTHPHTAHPHTPTHTHTHTPSPPGGFDQKIDVWNNQPFSFFPTPKICRPHKKYYCLKTWTVWLNGRAPDHGSGGCRFESCHGCFFFWAI